MACTTFTPLAEKVWFENLAKCVGNHWILYPKTNREALTVLSSVVKHLEISMALMK